MEAKTPALGDKPVMFCRKQPNHPHQKNLEEKRIANDLAQHKVVGVDACINSVIGGLNGDSSKTAK